MDSLSLFYRHFSSAFSVADFLLAIFCFLVGGAYFVGNLLLDMLRIRAKKAGSGSTTPAILGIHSSLFDTRDIAPLNGTSSFKTGSLAPNKKSIAKN